MTFPVHIPILLYHNVNEHSGGSTTSPAIFLKHLQWLADSGWKSLTLEEFESMVSGTLRAEPRRFLLTYDDGSVDLPYCAEVMESFEFTGVAFLITNHMQKQSSDCISIDDVRRLSQRKVLEFQSHTHKHVRVEKMPGGLEELSNDLIKSKTWLEKELGLASSSIRHLAWPWGQCTPEMEGMAREIGFEWQYLVQRGLVTKTADQLRLPRICADGMSLERFSFLMTLLSHRMTGQIINHFYGRIRKVRHGVAYW